MKLKNLKKGISLLIALTMLFAMIIPASAEVVLTGLWVDEAPVFMTEDSLSAQMLEVTASNGEILDFEYSESGSGEFITIGDVENSDEPDIWDGTVAEDAPTTKEIESATYYEIGSGAQLAWFANQVNGGQTEINAVLTNDIYLNGADDYTNKWNSRAIGNDGKFAGVFDGAGFTIYGLYSENKYVDQGGLFCYIGSTGVVKNLTLRDVKIATEYKNGQSYAASIAAHNEGTVKNCAAYGEIVAVNGGILDGVGGLVGFLNGGTISECYSEMNIISENGFNATSEASAYNSGVGGIAARAINNFTIEKTGNGGTINVPKLLKVGGIFGVMDAGDSAVFGECYNTGNIIGGWHVAGIFGYSNNANTVVSSSLYNTGNIEAKQKRAAGLFNNAREYNNNAGALNHASYSIGTVKAPATDTETGKSHSALMYTWDSGAGNVWQRFDSKYIYLDTTDTINWSVGILGNGDGVKRGTAMELKDIKTQNAVDTLNGWTTKDTYILDETINNGYPAFAWQKIENEDENAEVVANVLGLYVKFEKAPGVITINVGTPAEETLLSVYKVNEAWESGTVITQMPSYNTTAIDSAVITQGGEIRLDLGDADSIVLVPDKTLAVSNIFKGVVHLKNDVIKATMNLAVESGTESAMMIMVLYGSDGRMKNCTIGDTVTVGQIPVEVSEEFDLTNEDLEAGDYLKAFVWNGFTECTPLSPVSQITK